MADSSVVMDKLSTRAGNNLLSSVDASRRQVSSLLTSNKTALGQFFTPSSTASFMARLFNPIFRKRIRILDPGAGVGSLSTAFVDSILDSDKPDDIQIVAIEIDEQFHSYLEDSLEGCKEAAGKNRKKLEFSISGEDFIEYSLKRSTDSIPDSLQEGLFTHCIMNPPYRKINSQSHHRLALRTVGIEVVNLYAAFVALAVQQLEKHGELVAIIPRSFCNGPYYRNFRELILSSSAIHHIHLFDSRNQAFKEDDVLQENVIIHLEKGAAQGDICVSLSTDDSFNDLNSLVYAKGDIIQDHGSVIHVPMPGSTSIAAFNSRFTKKLSDLKINVSTGPVVDFRLRDHLSEKETHLAVPLLYPGHFRNGQMAWPAGGKKPDYISLNKHTLKWLYPSGFYTVVRRFTSKEENKRIVASVIDPRLINEHYYIGIENHLNVFHFNRQSLTEYLAWGLALFLNSSIVDDYFRRFSGHTQVNVSDLRSIAYPSSEQLEAIGRDYIENHSAMSQTVVDKYINGI